jgi:acyl-CoA synthetase (AMP-forming)/AMP-acid ligase II
MCLLLGVVTLLAVIAAKAIAVPLSPAFPPPELQYIVNQSEALILVSSAKFADKAEDVLATELVSKPAHLGIEKHLGGSAHDDVALEGEDLGSTGMMLYTSGTTNRPVWSACAMMRD